jgi:RND family efflux transporter MFP subunit
MCPKTLLVLALLLVAAPRATAGGEGDHGHGPAAAADTHGHEHAAEGRSVAVTMWTDALELFLEYPVLSAGHGGRFIIHLTILDGFQPVRDGRVTLAFRGPDGQRREFGAESLLREGIFAPEVTLPTVGAYGFTLEYAGTGVGGTFVIEGFTVLAHDEALPPEEAGDEGISFLKEQQWKVPFATAAAAVQPTRKTVRSIARVLPAPAAHVEVVAPVDGVIQARGAGDLALPGAEVRRGSVVVRLAPTLQGGGWTDAEIAYAQAERDLERARRLREVDAISARDFELAENEFRAREAGRRRLAGSGTDGVLSLTAAISGRVIDWRVRPGQHVRAGDHLMTIVDPGTVWLEARVYEQDFRGLGQPVGLYVNGGDADGGWSVAEGDLKVLSRGGALDPATRTIPVLLEVANAAGRLSINETVPVELVAGDGAVGLVVPREAVLRDEGVQVVYVQAGGETFERRVVRVGARHAGLVTVLEGLRPGERVVTRGAYHVKLASTTREIGHGHAH